MWRGTPLRWSPTRRPVGRTSVFSAQAVPGGGLQEDAYVWFAVGLLIDSMILPQVHLRKPCYDFSFL